MTARRAIADTGMAEKPEDLRVIKTRRALREALMTLMEDNEYSKITITMLANEACVNRKTFYMHYQCIDDLVAELLTENIRNICKNASLEYDESGSIQIFNGLTRLLLNALNENVDQELNLLRNVHLIKLSEMVVNPLEEVITSEMIARGIPVHDNLRADIACYAGCLLAGFIQWRFGDTSESLDDVAERVDRMAVGIAPAL